MAKKNCSVDMTMCPECVRYVRHCAGQATVGCPFCETQFSPADLEGMTPSPSAVSAGLKKGVMAISFAGATALGGVACFHNDVAHYGMPVQDVGYGDDADDEDVSDDADEHTQGDVDDDSEGDAGEEEG